MPSSLRSRCPGECRWLGRRGAALRGSSTVSGSSSSSSPSGTGRHAGSSTKASCSGSGSCASSSSPPHPSPTARLKRIARPATAQSVCTPKIQVSLRTVFRDIVVRAEGRRKAGAVLERRRLTVCCALERRIGRLGLCRAFCVHALWQRICLCICGRPQVAHLVRALPHNVTSLGFIPGPCLLRQLRHRLLRGAEVQSATHRARYCRSTPDSVAFEHPFHGREPWRTRRGRQGRRGRGPPSRSAAGLADGGPLRDALHARDAAGLAGGSRRCRERPRRRTRVGCHLQSLRVRRLDRAAARIKDLDGPIGRLGHHGRNRGHIGRQHQADGLASVVPASPWSQEPCQLRCPPPLRLEQEGVLEHLGVLLNGAGVPVLGPAAS